MSRGVERGWSHEPVAIETRNRVCVSFVNEQGNVMPLLLVDSCRCCYLAGLPAACPLSWLGSSVGVVIGDRAGLPSAELSPG